MWGITRRVALEQQAVVNIALTRDYQRQICAVWTTWRTAWHRVRALAHWQDVAWTQRQHHRQLWRMWERWREAYARLAQLTGRAQWVRRLRMQQHTAQCFHRYYAQFFMFFF